MAETAETTGPAREAGTVRPADLATGSSAPQHGPAGHGSCDPPLASIAPLVGRTGIVGRRDELAALEEAWEQARRGHGTTAVVTGPPGIGKTRLIAELARRHEAAREDVVVRAQCTADPDAPEHWPWVQVIRQCAQLLPVRSTATRLGRRVEHLLRAVPELATAFEAEGLRPGHATADDTFAFYDATISLLRVLADERPVAVLIDDVHWAGSGSLGLLDVVSRSTVDVPVLVVVAHRDLGPMLEPAAAGVLTRVARRGRRLALAGLTEQETALLMASRSGDDPPAALVREVHAVTGGNPLFVDEAVRLLATGGTLRGLDGLSATMLSTADRALSTLGQDELAALRAAAVAGAEFRETVVAAVLGRQPAHVRRLLAVAQARGFVEPVDADGVWTFTEPLLQAAVLAQLDPDSTADLHRRTGEVLCADASHRRAEPGEIAAHFVAAARRATVGPAVELCRDAAVAASRRHAYGEAVRWSREAVDLAYRDLGTTDARRLDLLLQLAEAEVRACQTRSARETFDRARRLGEQQDDAVAVARAVLGALGTRHRGLDGSTLDDVRPRLEHSAAALASQAAGQPALLAQVLAALVSVHTLTYEPVQARARAEEAARLARGSDDVVVRHAAVLAARWAAAGPGPVEVKEQLTDQLVLHAAQTDDAEAEWATQRWRLDDGLEAGDPDIVNRALSRTATLAEQLSRPDLVFHSYIDQAMVATIEGRFADARELHARAREHDLSAQVPERVILGQELYLGWETGDVDLALARAIRETLPRPLAHALMCWVAIVGDVLGDDHGTARSELDAFFDAVDLDQLPDGNLLPVTLAMVAEAVACTGMAEHAERVRERLLPLADLCAVTNPGARVWGGSNHLYLGMLATVLHDHDAADRHLDAADRVHRRMGARCHLVRGQIWRARLAARRGDEATARELLGAARREADTLGMAAAAADASRQLARLTPRTIDLTTGWVLRRDGTAWQLSAGTATRRLRNRKGLGYLHALLDRAGQEIHVLDLVGSGELRGDTGAGPPLDADAKEAYRRRVEDLRDQIDEGERWGDPERVSRAREELDAIARELAGAVGLGGRDRPSDAGERARVSVTKAIRSAISAVAEVAPDAGAHLAATVRTGYYCAYEPDPAADAAWTT